MANLVELATQVEALSEGYDAAATDLTKKQKELKDLEGKVSAKQAEVNEESEALNSNRAPLLEAITGLIEALQQLATKVRGA